MSYLALVLPANPSDSARGDVSPAQLANLERPHSEPIEGVLSHSECAPPSPVPDHLKRPLQRSQSPKVAAAIDMYMAEYAGRDSTRGPRMLWWREQIGHLTLTEIDSDHIYFALNDLASKPARYWAGTDADGKPIFKSKGKPYAQATINRYAATISALFTWCVHKRLTPKQWEHPCRGIERRPENNEVVRFLSKEERERLLEAAQKSKWPKLYLLVLLGLTTGARRGELMNLRWADIDFERSEARIARTKNSEPKVLPLLNTALNLLQQFRSAPERLIFASRKFPDQPFNFVPCWQLALKQAKVKAFRFHDLRHSCASYLAQEGATLLEIADVLGHRQISVTKRYSHLTTHHKARLLKRVLGHIS